MVKLKLQICFSFLLFFSCAGINAQTAAYEELVIQVPGADEGRSVPQIKTDLLALGGIQFVDYCESLKCFLLKIDRSVHASNQQVDTFFETRLIPYYIKNGVSIGDLLVKCKAPVSGAIEAK
ncbi:MAG: hypothetical protein M3R27_02860 [Bacteroidota bacterium]|nr:hypothetical protein [Bacteroidota bacterium]